MGFIYHLTFFVWLKTGFIPMEVNYLKMLANLHSVVDEGGQAVLHVGLDNVSIQRIVHADLGGIVHGVLGKDGDGGVRVGYNRFVP